MGQSLQPEGTAIPLPSRNHRNCKDKLWQWNLLLLSSVVTTDLGQFYLGSLLENIKASVLAIVNSAVNKQKAD
jgi:hypothetical protein